MIMAIDPGSSESAWVRWDSKNLDKPLFDFLKEKNDIILSALRLDTFEVDSIVIEMISSYGMPVGKEVFDTCVWIGRFAEASHLPFKLVYRKDVKMYLCNSMRAKDTNIRQALIDRFEPNLKPKERPKGILKGVSKDVWAAIAVAVYASEVKE